MCNFMLHFSLYSIARNPIFLSYMHSSTFPNFLSSLQQIEPTPRQVRNLHSQKNQEAHLEWTLAFKKAANHDCPSNVCLPFFWLCALCCRLLMSPISLIQQDNDTNHEIDGNECQMTGKFTKSSDIPEDDLDQPSVVLHLGQARWD